MKKVRIIPVLEIIPAPINIEKDSHPTKYSNDCGCMNAGVLLDSIDEPIDSENFRDLFDNYNSLNVHGGITYDEFVTPITDMSKTLIPYKHDIDFNKRYLALLWDTCHAGDTKDKWPIWKIMEENNYLIADIASYLHNSDYVPIF